MIINSSFYIGLGSFGIRILDSLKSNFQESYEDLSSIGISFIGLDSNINEINKCENLKKGSELFDLTIDNINEEFISAKQESEYDWITQNEFPNIKGRFGSALYRQVGNLIYHKNHSFIKKIILGKIKLSYREGNTELSIFIFTSIFGGTGSSWLLNVSADLQDIADSLSMNLIIIPFLIGIDFDIIDSNKNDTTRKIRKNANAYALIKELCLLTNPSFIAEYENREIEFHFAEGKIKVNRGIFSKIIFIQRRDEKGIAIITTKEELNKLIFNYTNLINNNFRAFHNYILETQQANHKDSAGESSRFTTISYSTLLFPRKELESYLRYHFTSELLSKILFPSTSNLFIQQRESGNLHVGRLKNKSGVYKAFGGVLESAELLAYINSKVFPEKNFTPQVLKTRLEANFNDNDWTNLEKKLHVWENNELKAILPSTLEIDQVTEEFFKKIDSILSTSLDEAYLRNLGPIFTKKNLEQVKSELEEDLSEVIIKIEKTEDDLVKEDRELSLARDYLWTFTNDEFNISPESSFELFSSSYLSEFFDIVQIQRVKSFLEISRLILKNVINLISEKLKRIDNLIKELETELDNSYKLKYKHRISLDRFFCENDDRRIKDHVIFSQDELKEYLKKFYGEIDLESIYQDLLIDDLFSSYILSSNIELNDIDKIKDKITRKIRNILNQCDLSLNKFLKYLLQQTYKNSILSQLDSLVKKHSIGFIDANYNDLPLKINSFNSNTLVAYPNEIYQKEKDCGSTSTDKIELLMINELDIKKLLSLNSYKYSYQKLNSSLEDNRSIHILPQADLWPDINPDKFENNAVKYFAIGLALGTIIDPSEVEKKCIKKRFNEEFRNFIFRRGNHYYLMPYYEEGKNSKLSLDEKIIRLDEILSKINIIYLGNGRVEAFLYFKANPIFFLILNKLLSERLKNRDKEYLLKQLELYRYNELNSRTESDLDLLVKMEREVISSYIDFIESSNNIIPEIIE